MKIIRAIDENDLAKIAAEKIASVIKYHPGAVLILPADNTSVKTYRNLVRMYQCRQISFKNVVTFNLDEYVRSDQFHRMMLKNLFLHLDIKAKNIHLLNGYARDLRMGCENYAKLYSQNAPADLCVLGIGQNGHIAFNEPGSSVNSTTRPVALDAKTVSVNQSPDAALTMGISEILNSKQVLLLAQGENKATAVSGMISGPVSKSKPASFLQNHPNVEIIVDKTAGSKI